MKKIVVLTGAGMSAESGISTFRDANGLWEQHPIEEVATPQAWTRNPELVLRFYNARRKQLFDVQPNPGHLALAALEDHAEVYIVTQNVDDLHERAGSTRVLHLHGELRKVRSEKYDDLVYEWTDDLHLGNACERGTQLRPHIVWFGEPVPMMSPAAEIAAMADVFVVIGTSLQVYPAAGLMHFSPKNIPFFYIDPNPSVNFELARAENLKIIAEPAGTGVQKAINHILNL